ncbi:MAG TPA: hypothetical protein PK878_10835 [bacterium]|nr:hypothetical protein [Candidatus Omnitrophota bacterium]HOJ60771.1 hypothetical protein [bacterium]HOL96113.1 hypothetical protein [bacterium]HPP02629.1 hypothetical protein [bacterium]
MIKKSWPIVLSMFLLAVIFGCASAPKSSSGGSASISVPQGSEETRVQSQIDKRVDEISAEKRTKFRLRSLFR